MPSFFAHLAYSLAIAAVFVFFSVAVDLDHITKCDAKAIATSAIDQKKGSEMLEALGQGKDCRGFVHTWRFGILAMTIALAWILHMVLDYVVYPVSATSHLPW